MGTHRLICHPDTPAVAVRNISVTVYNHPFSGLLVRWRVDGCSALVLPAYSGSGRADDLWQTTCFEMFTKGAGEAYEEYNFSPSQRWAAYRFSSYRQNREDIQLGEGPVIDHQSGDRLFVLTAKLPGVRLNAERLGLSAVIEEEGEVKSYWALAHPDGAPDFHDASCFTAPVPAPQLI